jgi:hypothetical protein
MEYTRRKRDKDLGSSLFPACPTESRRYLVYWCHTTVASKVNDSRVCSDVIDSSARDASRRIRLAIGRQVGPAGNNHP